MSDDVTDTPAAIEFLMPSLGADMTEGSVVEWLVAPGDHLARGDLVAVVETDKSDIDVEIFEAATMREFLVPIGERVPIGTPIALIEPDQPSRRVASERRVAAQPVPTAAGVTVRRPSVAPPTPEAPPEPAAPAPSDRPRVRVTPRARRMAVAAGLSARQLDALAVDGRPVTGDDVARMPPVDPMRRKIAELMSRSWREIPHYHLERRLDLTAALHHLRTANTSLPIADRILPAALLLAATARAAHTVPECNGWWLDDRFVAADHVHVGVVLSLRTGGVIVPTISDADELDVVATMHRLGQLVDRARHGRLRASDLSPATITVTNVGDQGADVVFGVIHPPQVALVGFGAVHDEVWPDESGSDVRPTVRASLAGDHRATDGVTGSRFLAELQRALSHLLPQEAS